jgi:transglutaminase-like putative cysteine protease
MPPASRTLILLAAALAAVFPARAARQSISEAALAGDTEIQCRFTRDQRTECLSTYRYTILAPAGRDLVSRIDRSYAENDELQVERAELVQPGEQPVALDAAQIDTRMAPNPEQGFLRHKQTSLAFPNLRVGSTIVYTLRERFASVPLATQLHHVLELPPGPVRHDRYRAEFIADRPMVWRAQAMDAYRIEAAPDARRITLELKAPPYYHAYVNESENGYLRQTPRLEIGSSSSLQEYFAPFIRRYNEILAATLPSGAAAAVAAQRGKAAPQIVASLMRHLNENYRYLGDWRSSERGQIPFALDEIERRGYGDCKDLAVMLVAMLRAAGIAAEPALVARGTVAPPLLLPGTAAPNHVIVRAQIEGATWWLDPTNPVFLPGFTMPDLQQRWVLIMDRQGRMRREEIPLEGPATSLAVTRHERFRDKGQAAVHASVELQRMAAAEIFVGELRNGVTATDQSLCSNFATEHRDCRLQRTPVNFVVPATYFIDATLINLRALERVGTQYVYGNDLGKHWQYFDSYRQTGQVADIYLGTPETISYEVTLGGGRIDAPRLQCRVHSPWIDQDLDGRSAASGYRFRYSSVRKVSWFSHEDIVSEAFGQAIAQGRNCVQALRMVVRLTGQ